VITFTELQMWVLLGVLAVSTFAMITIIMVSFNRALDAAIAGVRAEISGFRDDMNAGFDRMNARFDALNSKFDKVNRDI
jgi:hypothetical protein